MSRLRLLLIGGLFIGLMAWAFLDCQRESLESAARTVPAAPDPAAAAAEAAELERLATTPSVASDPSPVSMEWRVICQEFRASGARIPLADAELRVQIADADAESLPVAGASDASGAAILSIPLHLPFVLIGACRGARARRPLEALTPDALERLYPNGIELDFFLEPATVAYEITGGLPDFDATWFLMVKNSPIPRRAVPRTGASTAPIALPLRAPPLRGEFQVDAGEVVHWALLDSRGQPRITGDSGRALLAGESWPLPIHLDEISFPPRRHFLVIEGLELVQAQWMSSIRFVHFDEGGTLLSEDSAVVDDSGKSSILLDDTGAERILLLCGSMRPQWLTLQQGEGSDPAQPIPLRFEASPRVFVHRADFPELVPGPFTLTLRTGAWITGSVRSVDDAPERLELIAAWGAEVRSVRLGNRIHLVRLDREAVVLLPGPQIQPLPHAEARACTVWVDLAEPLEERAELDFRVRGESWQRLNVSARGTRKFQVQLALPDEPGEVLVRDGRGPVTRLPYTPDAGVVRLNWINR